MMRLKSWEELPEHMKNDRVKVYYDMLSSKQGAIVLKRCFDAVVSVIVAAVLLPVMLILSIIIKIDSSGPVIFGQERVTTYGRKFKIYKFRTMINGADKIGAAVTTKGDIRITRVGRILRKVRLDELPQIFNIIKGDMSFVGTRPEVPKYVNRYTDEMYATLLLPAGVTSLASIKYKDEEMLLEDCEDIDSTYLNKILPEKMKHNLKYLEHYTFFYDIKIMFMTVLAVISKKEEKKEESVEVEVNV